MSNNKQSRKISQQSEHSGVVKQFSLYNRVRARDNYVAPENSCVNRGSVCTNISDINFSREGTSAENNFPATDGVISDCNGGFLDVYKKCASVRSGRCNILRAPLSGYRNTLSSKRFEFKRILRDNKSRACCHAIGANATTRNENLKRNNNDGESNMDYSQYLKHKGLRVMDCKCDENDEKKITRRIKDTCCNVRRIKPIVDKTCDYKC